ncbi:MBL fold metallo-hydrolase [Luteimonas sp. BDR2-5]|uniref:MBL fold metallo-hydrolase n=1 Tax=Proluteimonas luteida TaxID=2878685 RepID=UPI001E642B1E|nr:MBL fold metallo-hydrolase [Luteimonas sp. BDR2-5]MCD9028810.1 MBL fold metallo-hydrolase [Luteimonas sp. BDR2-5]
MSPFPRPGLSRRRRIRRRVLLSVFALGVALAVSTCTLSAVRTTAPLVDYPASPQSADGRFRNPVPRPPMPAGGMARIWWDFMWNKPAGTVPQTAPEVLPLTRADLDAAPDRSLFRLGHSTVLLKLRGGFWITDPVFAERASPVQWMGPKRFHAPPIALDELPPLRGVILSHDHYDHLDRDTVVRLAGRAGVFLAPLGVGDRLVAWGVPADKVRQFDWWQGATIDGLQFTATPAQHFSGRGLFDGDRTLWTSWAIIDPPAGDGDPGLRLFFSGDSGYFDGFAEIGRRFGPFDVTMIETGAYDPRWAYVHMLPEQTVQAHADLRGRWLLPVHNGTFDLAFHAWDDPFERVAALGAERGIDLATPRMGERLDLSAPQPTEAWWRD